MPKLRKDSIHDEGRETSKPKRLPRGPVHDLPDIKDEELEGLFEEAIGEMEEMVGEYKTLKGDVDIAMNALRDLSDDKDYDRQGIMKLIKSRLGGENIPEQFSGRDEIQTMLDSMESAEDARRVLHRANQEVLEGYIGKSEDERRQFAEALRTLVTEVSLKAGAKKRKK